MIEQDDEYDIIFKIIIVGDTGVGKTNILKRYLENKFDQNSKSTIGVEFGTKNIKLNDKVIKAQIWDTAGQERYRSITSAYYRGAQGAFVVYDITRKETFDSIDKWVSDLKNNGDEKIIIHLIGNKTDLEDKREIKIEEGQEKAKENSVPFLETSALNANNIEKAFIEMLNDIYATYKTELDEESEGENDDESKKKSAVDLNTVTRVEKSSCC